MDRDGDEGEREYGGGAEESGITTRASAEQRSQGIRVARLELGSGMVMFMSFSQAGEPILGDGGNASSREELDAEVPVDDVEARRAW